MLSSGSPTVPFNFGGLSSPYSRWEEARVVFLPVLYDLTCTYHPGARRGPLAILEASTHLELFDEELKVETFQIGLHTLDPLEAVASGPEEMIRQVRTYAQKVLAANKFPVLLGGEHTVTMGVAQAIKGKHPQISFLQLDAHADLRADFAGTPFSHACVGRRLAELGPLVQVGLRSLSKEEDDFLKSSDVVALFWHELVATPAWEEKLWAALSPEVYVTIDLDVLDPAVMPAVGTPEPGGFDWLSLVKLLRLISKKKKVVGFDVVELTPIPGMVSPDFLAAKLIYRFLGEIFIDSLKKKA